MKKLLKKIFRAKQRNILKISSTDLILRVLENFKIKSIHKIIAKREQLEQHRR